MANREMMNKALLRSVFEMNVAFLKSIFKNQIFS